jgi:hypothetical protein
MRKRDICRVLVGKRKPTKTLHSSLLLRPRYRYENNNNKVYLSNVSYRDRLGGQRPDLTDSRHVEGYNDKGYEPSGFLK